MKSLIALPERCTGCQRCVLACSYAHAQSFSPSKSRIWVMRAKRKIDYPVFCNQCGLCINACPTGALYRDAKTRAVIIDENKCIGCGFCVGACPWGLIILDPGIKKAIKCDLCGGNPACVKECPEKALLFVDLNEAAFAKRSLFIRLMGE
ncbi:MAG: 4Fe-4S dicluster domain-containing protein [Nitrososphaerota archaeon]